MDNRNRQGQSRNDGDSSGDNPIYSRLFVIGDKKMMNKDCMSNAFSSFGQIDDIKIPYNSNGDPKGVCFIKFSKTSEAANALEAMHLNVLPDTSMRPLKVLVAVNRSEVERNDEDEEKYKRLFIHIPRNMNEDDLEGLFNVFGKLRSVVIQRDHNSGESKGFAYVSFSKFSEAARAYEECGRQYRPVFAKPKLQKRLETSFESNIGLLAESSTSKNSLILMMGNQIPGRFRGFKKVNFMCCPQVTQSQMESLFDVIPGMVDFTFFIDRFRNCGQGTVSYSNPTSAAYAVSKLNQFEYPPGMKVFVRPDKSNYGGEENNFINIPGAVSKLRTAMNSTNPSGGPDLVQLAEAIAEASKLVKIATGDVGDDYIPDSNDINYCSVKLPSTQPLADIDRKMVKRCFLVCKPAPPPLTVLRDIFCRFGDLINVYTLPNKTVGYARYASAGSADAAIKALHGAEVCGVRMKVMEADEESDPRKRKYDEM